MIIALGVFVVWLTFFRKTVSPVRGELDNFSAQLSVVVTPTPIQLVVELITATPVATLQPLLPTPTEFAGIELSQGYTKQLVLGRFSNYDPYQRGENCQGECELFADGTRVDQALFEDWLVVACPQELLLGTRIEFPPDSGMVWTCRDRGSDIFFYYSEAGTPIYWFDFLGDVAWVDFGSYIQVQVWVPEGVIVP